MNPGDLIPTPDTIPVGWGWFQVLLSATFLLHVVLMNLMLGGTLIAFFNSLRGGMENLETARYASKKLPFAVALAVNAGVAPLLFLQVLYGQFVYTSSILMAASWLTVFVLAIFAYYGMYLFNYKFDSWGSGRNFLVGGSGLILLFIGFLFTNNWTLAMTPEKWSAYFDSPGGRIWNLDEPTLWPRYLHMVIGALAVGGLGLAAFGRVRQKSGTDSASLVTEGMNWFKIATVLQFGVGTWWLMALPKETMKLFMGGNMVATAAFGIGFFVAIVALVLGFKKLVWPTVWTTLVVMAAMVVLREYVRYGYVREYFTPDQLTVNTQYSSLILFLVSVVIGVAAVWYMLKLASNAGKEV
jgi:hypothetical protein